MKCFLLMFAIALCWANGYEFECQHSACMENGSPDGDCCALSTQGGCSSGFQYYSGSTCYTGNGAKDTCCLPDTCVKDACLEHGSPDNDCCGAEDATSCLPPYEKQLGDICWNPNGARRVCCVLPSLEPVCDHSACMENGAADGDCCALSTQGGCSSGFQYFHGSTCYNPNGAKETCCLPQDMCHKPACLEHGNPDDDCCGQEEETSCSSGFVKTTGDICWEPNGARRTCCTPVSDRDGETQVLSAESVKAPSAGTTVLMGACAAGLLTAGAAALIAFRKMHGPTSQQQEPLLA